MLSSYEEDWYEITVKEQVPDELVPQVLKIKVAPVFSFNQEEPLGIWIRHYDDVDDGNSYNPIIIDYKTWKAVNRHVRRRWRDSTSWVYIFSGKVTRWASGRVIRLL